MAVAADIALVSGIGIAQTNLLNPSTTAKMNLKPVVADGCKGPITSKDNSSKGLYTLRKALGTGASSFLNLLIFWHTVHSFKNALTCSLEGH